MITMTEEELESVVSRVNEAVAVIDEGRFDATSGYRTRMYCDYQKLCYVKA